MSLSYRLNKWSFERSCKSKLELQELGGNHVIVRKNLCLQWILLNQIESKVSVCVTAEMVEANLTVSSADQRGATSQLPPGHGS